MVGRDCCDNRCGNLYRTWIGRPAEGAYQALAAKSPDEHDECVLQAAKKIAAEADVMVLAQGSMARMENELKEKTGIPALSSPPLCVREIKSVLSS